ncbi:hypothetical protein L484_002196 [Morus notabilis]|uniref:Uncharacterized protein n=1 Tax=Morus notabilis TaxID=981085 RepID=W9SH33_9ROSA|nr:hypothetical protein L484_002196 [Morus notabilis]
MSNVVAAIEAKGHFYKPSLHISAKLHGELDLKVRLSSRCLRSSNRSPTTTMTTINGHLLFTHLSPSMSSSSMTVPVVTTTSHLYSWVGF